MNYFSVTIQVRRFPGRLWQVVNTCIHRLWQFWAYVTKKGTSEARCEDSQWTEWFCFSGMCPPQKPATGGPGQCPSASPFCHSLCIFGGKGVLMIQFQCLIFWSHLSSYNFVFLFSPNWEFHLHWNILEKGKLHHQIIKKVLLYRDTKYRQSDISDSSNWPSHLAAETPEHTDVFAAAHSSCPSCRTAKGTALRSPAWKHHLDKWQNWGWDKGTSTLWRACHSAGKNIEPCPSAPSVRRWEKKWEGGLLCLPLPREPGVGGAEARTCSLSWLSSGFCIFPNLQSEIGNQGLPHWKLNHVLKKIISNFRKVEKIIRLLPSLTIFKSSTTFVLLSSAYIFFLNFWVVWVTCAPFTFELQFIFPRNKNLLWIHSPITKKRPCHSTL